MNYNLVVRVLVLVVLAAMLCGVASAQPQGYPNLTTFVSEYDTDISLFWLRVTPRVWGLMIGVYLTDSTVDALRFSVSYRMDDNGLVLQKTLLVDRQRPGEVGWTNGVVDLANRPGRILSIRISTLRNTGDPVEVPMGFSIRGD
jgi:hypothetical protein